VSWLRRNHVGPRALISMKETAAVLLQHEIRENPSRVFAEVLAQRAQDSSKSRPRRFPDSSKSQRVDIDVVPGEDAVRGDGPPVRGDRAQQQIERAFLIERPPICRRSGAAKPDFAKLRSLRAVRHPIEAAMKKIGLEQFSSQNSSPNSECQRVFSAKERPDIPSGASRRRRPPPDCRDKASVYGST